MQSTKLGESPSRISEITIYQALLLEWVWETPKYVTDVITSAANDKCVNPLRAIINITVRNRNPQICVDPRIYTRVNFCDHHQLSTMVELFSSLIDWIIVAVTLSSSSAAISYGFPLTGIAATFCLFFHKQKLQTATEINLSRQTESFALSLTSRVCSSQPYSNVFQEFAINFTIATSVFPKIPLISSMVSTVLIDSVQHVECFPHQVT